MGDRGANPSSFKPPWNYDVCFSFAGEDTGAGNFTGYLYNAFCRKGIRVFMGEKPDEEGEEISEAVIKVMEQSRISIVIFSENYAYSTWRLDQLIKILEFRETKGQVVIPVFYGVHSSDVIYERKSFGKAVFMHVRRFDEDDPARVHRLRRALTEAANLSGWDLPDGNESDYVRKITDDVIRRLSLSIAEAKNLGSTMMGDRWPNSSSSSSFQHPWNYDVYLSFQDTDTGSNFTSHLYRALCARGIDTFIDDRIEKGEELTQAHLKACEQSRISIIIFSENYANSTLCLDELVKIMENKETKGQLVLPIFYKVEPSVVRLQSASFAKALHFHEERFGPGPVRAWRWALEETATLHDWDLETGFKYEYQRVQRITEEVTLKLKGGDQAKNIRPSGSGKSRRDISNWKKGDLLGRGSFGSVYEGIDKHGFFFAIKEVSLLDQGNQGKQSVYQLKQEIDLLSQWEHKNIVQYYGAEMDESNLYVFLELATKGSLKSIYKTYPLQYPQVSAYTRQILHGLKYLHDQNVIHRDIKCANILVDADGSVKLADFGLAKAINFSDAKSCKGTANWMAPEVVRGKNQGYGLPADIWSLGCTVLEMFTRKSPYEGFEPFQALFRIGKGELPDIPEEISEDARDFILKCLKVNPNERLTAAQLLNHSFVM